MAFENKLAAVSPQAFTANGTSLGVVTIASTAGFYIKQVVDLQSNSLQQTRLQIKNILSSTQLIVGPNNNSLAAGPKNVTDISGFTVSDAASISAPEQNNFPIPRDDHYNAVYLPAPVSADRVMPVDPYGELYGPNNPLPVSFEGGVSIANVGIIGPAPDKNQLDVNVDGSINTINLAQLVPKEFNEIDLTNSVIAGQTVPTVVVYKQASSVVATLTLTYDGSANLLNVVRT